MADTYVKQIKITADTKQLEKSIKAFQNNLKDVEKQLNASLSSPLKTSVKDFSTSFKKSFKEALGFATSEVDELKAMLGDIDAQLSIKTKKRDALVAISKSSGATKEEREAAEAQAADLTGDINRLAKEKMSVESDVSEAQIKENRQMYSKLGAAAGKKLGEVFDKIGEMAKKFLSDMLKGALEMMDEIASYNLETSTKFNKEAVDLATSYGLVGGEAYGTQQAAKQLGFSGVDELIDNMWAMNDKQIERFTDLQEQYKKSYEEDMEMAQAYQQFETEWADFKKEFQRDLLSWFSDNKDTIKAVLEGLMDFMKVVLDILGAIADAFGTGHERSSTERAGATSDIINSYKNNTNNNVSVSNTFNVSGNSGQTNAQLSKAGSTTYRQIINAFK